MTAGTEVVASLFGRRKELIQDRLRIVKGRAEKSFIIIIQ